MITLAEAKALRRGDMIHSTNQNNADGTPVRWRVTGKVKTWVRSPDRVHVPLKHGLRTYDVLDETNLHLVSLGDGLSH